MIFSPQNAQNRENAIFIFGSLAEHSASSHMLLYFIFAMKIIH